MCNISEKHTNSYQNQTLILICAKLLFQIILFENVNYLKSLGTYNPLMNNEYFGLVFDRAHKYHKQK